MLVLDTSAYLNGRRDHYPPPTFPSVWQLVADAMADGRIITPRAVYLELVAKDDEVTHGASSSPTTYSSTRSRRFNAGWERCMRGLRTQDVGTALIRL